MTSCTWPPTSSVTAGPSPLYGYVQQVHFRHPREQRRGEMGIAADAARPVRHGARLRLGECEQLPDRLCGHGRMHDDDVGLFAQHRHRREILQRVVRQLRIEDGIDGDAHAGDKERVAVRPRLGDDVGADRAAGPAAVVHHDRLPEGVRQPRRDRARHQVHRAAGRERHHYAHRPRRIRLCRQRRGQCE